MNRYDWGTLRKLTNHVLPTRPPFVSRSVFSGLLLLTLILCSCSERATLSEAVLNLELNTLSGERIALSATKGPVLVNFWSTDCVICVHEMPEMARLYTDYSDQGFELIAVAMPYDPPNKVLELAEQKNLPFPVALDLKGEAVKSFETVKGTPTSYLLDKDLRLVEQYIGAIQMDELRKELESLLAKG